MHRSDVLVIGPLEPLLTRALRVQLRLAIVGTLAVTCAATGVGLVLLVKTGVLPVSVREALVQAVPGQAPAHDSTATAAVEVTSAPSGATILLGSRELGTTPAAVNVRPGQIVVLRHGGFLDTFVRVRSSSSLDIPLWHAQPDIRLVRPPMPGTAVRSAEFLPDGRVALGIEIPTTRERQAWAYDPANARLDRLGSAAAPGALPGAVAIAPDGIHTAAIVHLDGLDGAAADQLLLDGPEGPRQPLSITSTGERLLDVCWSPRADSLLTVSQRRVAGGMQFVLRRIGVDGSIRELVQLSGEPVAGSWSWAPDGQAVAFLVQTNMTSLIALDITSGELRYLDDLRPDTLPHSGAVAPATWEPSGGLLYAAPKNVGFPGSSGSSSPVLWEVAKDRVDAHRVGDVEPVWAPIVRADGVLLTLARAQGDTLVLRPVDPAGHVLAEQPLGVKVSGAYSARWDLAHQQLLIVRGTSGGGVEVLLLRFGPDVLTQDGRSSSAEAEAGQ
jgi:hypothetical protein